MLYRIQKNASIFGALLFSYLTLQYVKSSLLNGEVKIPTDTGRPARFFIRDPYGRGTYKYGYDTGGDGIISARSFKLEERDPNGVVRGEYGYVDPYGILKRYEYIADRLGYRVQENTEKLEQRTIPQPTRRPTTTMTTTTTRRPTSKPRTLLPQTTRSTTPKPTTPQVTNRPPVSVRRPPINPLIIGPIPRPFFPPLDN